MRVAADAYDKILGNYHHLSMLTIATLYDGMPCHRVECTVRAWHRSASRLARAMSRGGTATRILVVTRCPLAGIQTRPPPDELKRAIARLRDRRRGEGAVATIDSMYWLQFWKLAIFDVTTRWTAFFDIDTDVLPPNSSPRLAAMHWRRALRKLDQDDARVFTRADGASPLNGGFILAKRTPRLYEEALELLDRVKWNDTHGWGLVGPPRRSFPKYDPAWRVNRGRLQSLKDDTWLGWGGGADQGFLYYYLRVVTRQGAELGLLRQPNRDYAFWHYVGQCKPYDCAFRACERMSQRRRNDVVILANVAAYVLTAAHEPICAEVWRGAQRQLARCAYDSAISLLPESRPVFEMLRVPNASRAQLRRVLRNSSVVRHIRPAQIAPFSEDIFGGRSAEPPPESVVDA